MNRFGEGNIMTIRRATVLFVLTFLFLAGSILIQAGSTAANTSTQSQPAAPASLQLENLLTTLTNPVFVTNAHDGSNRLFVVEQAGHIRVLQPGATAATDFLNITARVLSGGERGLLGLAFHPFYKNNGRFFVYYTRQTDGAIQIAEYNVSSNPNVADTTERIIITIPHPVNANHNGGTVAFGPD